MASSYIYVLSLLYLAASVSSLTCWKGASQDVATKNNTCATGEDRCLMTTTYATGVIETKCIKESEKPDGSSDVTSTDDPKCANTTDKDYCICKKADDCNDPTKGSACDTQLKCYQGDTAAKATESKDCPTKCADRCGKETNKDGVVKTQCLLSKALLANYKDVTGTEKSKCEKVSDVEYCVYKEAGANTPSSSTALESMIFSMIASTLLVKVVVY